MAAKKQSGIIVSDWSRIMFIGSYTDSIRFFRNTGKYFRIFLSFVSYNKSRREEFPIRPRDRSPNKKLSITVFRVLISIKRLTYFHVNSSNRSRVIAFKVTLPQLFLRYFTKGRSRLKELTPILKASKRQAIKPLIYLLLMFYLEAFQCGKFDLWLSSSWGIIPRQKGP